MSIIRTNEQRIKNFLKETEEIFYDPSFQRPSGCWSNANHNGYIKSVFRGYSSTPIVVACINTCLRHSRNRDNSNSESYYAKRSQRGDSYISLDGQHRALCISEFVNNSRTYTGEITDDDGNSMWVKNRFFKDLEKSYRDHFMNQNVVVQRFERVLRDELPKIFKGLNSNSGLTDQHQRNACQTPFAQWTREVASQHKHMFEAILAPKSFEKMQPHQFISKLFMHIDDPMSSVGKKALDDFYEKGEGDYSFANKYSEDVKNKVQKILRTLRHIYQTLQKQKISNNNLLTLSLVLDKWYSKGLDPQEPIDGDRFVETVTNADLALLFKSKQQEVDDQKKGINKTAVSYYHEKKRLNWSSTARADRQDLLFKEFLKTWRRILKAA